MPTPKKDESKEKFIERCIPIVLDEGTAKDGDQAYAICNSLWEKKRGGQKRDKEPAMYVKLDEMERRCLPAAELRIEGDKSPKIVGYAAVFDTWTDIGGWFKESIRKGAFKKTIKENDIRALVNHNENYVLGRKKAGTVKLREDSKGLAVEIEPPPTIWANDLMASMRRGDVDQMSFGFYVNKQEVDYEKDERVLTDVTLFDVSIVTFPAYPTTSAEVRAAFAKNKARDPEEDDVAELVAPVLDSLAGGSVLSEFDKLVQKIASGEQITEEEASVLSDHIRTLVVPPAQHTTNDPEPPAQHSETDTRVKDRWAELLIKAERIAPTKNLKKSHA